LLFVLVVLVPHWAHTPRIPMRLGGSHFSCFAAINSFPGDHSRYPCSQPEKYLQYVDGLRGRASGIRCARQACCTRRWLKTVTKRSFRTTARSGPSVLPQCAAPRVGTSWSAPAVSRRVHCKRSRVNPTSHSGEHSAPSQCSWPHPPPSWPKAWCQRQIQRMDCRPRAGRQRAQGASVDRVRYENHCPS
jgi:hypothetical protein